MIWSNRRKRGKVVSVANEIYNMIRFNSTEDLEHVLDVARSEELAFDFDKILPTPSELKGEDALGWRIEAWGVEWKPNTCSGITPLSVSGNDICFSTPWSTPLGIYKALVELFPDMSFTAVYDDEDNYWEGVFKAAGDGSWSNEQWNFKEVPKGGDCDRNCEFSKDCPEDCASYELCREDELHAELRERVPLEVQHEEGTVSAG